MAGTVKPAFTIMEILIVAIIICIIAAAAAPRVGRANSEAKLGALVDNLQAVRSQIQLYKVQHSGLLPGQKGPGGDIVERDFIIALTARGADGFGPYLKKIPSNCYVTGDAADNVTCVSDANAVAVGTERTGWWFNTATGQFRACDSDFHAIY